MLLLTGTSAFGGLALLPASADTGPHSAAAASADGALPPHVLSLAQAATVERERATNEAATQAAAALRVRERASRSRVRPPAVVASAAARAAAARSAAARAAAARAAATPARPAAKAYVRPGIGRLTSRFGQRWGRLHAGIDLASGIGSPVRAVAAGRVLSAGEERGYGRCVRVQHPDGTVSLYGHMSAILVRAGQPVNPGSTIGREGNTGHSTGPHLHFEVRVAGKPVDPIPWLLARGIDPRRP